MPDINKGWIKRFDRLHDIMQHDIVYMDFINKTRNKTLTETFVEIRIHHIPYPRLDFNDNYEEIDSEKQNSFSREIMEWMGNSIELCAFSLVEHYKKTFIDIWEACAFASIITVTGTDVFVGTRQRYNAKGEIQLAQMVDFDSSLRVASVGNFYKNNTKYMEFSKLLKQGKSAFSIFDEIPSPPIREKVFQEDKENHIQQIGGNELW